MSGRLRVVFKRVQRLSEHRHTFHTTPLPVFGVDVRRILAGFAGHCCADQHIVELVHRSGVSKLMPSSSCASALRLCFSRGKCLTNHYRARVNRDPLGALRRQPSCRLFVAHRCRSLRRTGLMHDEDGGPHSAGSRSGFRRTAICHAWDCSCARDPNATVLTRRVPRNRRRELPRHWPSGRQ